MSRRNSSQLPDETTAKVKIEGMSPNEPLCCERGTLPRAVPERTARSEERAVFPHVDHPARECRNPKPNN